MPAQGGIKGDAATPVVVVDGNGNPTPLPGVLPDGMEVQDIALRLIPNGTNADQALTVDATAGGVKLSAFDALTTHILITCETAQIRFTLDGSAPTATNGHIMEAGDVAVWRKEMAVAAKFIRTGGTSAVLSASQLIVA